MNAKKAKILRAMARNMSTETAKQENRLPIADGLLVDRRHEIRSKTHGIHQVTAVNNPRSDRGVYRWLKKETST